MGSLDSRLFTGAGMVSALLFLVAGVLNLMEGSGSTAGYLAAAAGVLAIVYSINFILIEGIFVKKICGATIALAGIIAAVSAFVMGATVVAVCGFIAAVAMLSDAANSWIVKMKGLMIVSLIFAIIELVLSVMLLIGGSSLIVCGVFAVFGVWIAAAVVFAMILGTSSGAQAPVAEPKMEKKEAKPKKQVEKKVQPAAPKSEPKKQEPVKKEAQKKAPVPEVKKQDLAKVETPKQDPKKQEPVVEKKSTTAEPVKKESPAPATQKIRADEPVPKKDEAPAEVKATPKPDFMNKLLSSKAVHDRAVPVKEEPEVVKKEPVKEVPEKEDAPVVVEPHADEIPGLSGRGEPEAVDIKPDVQEPVVDPEPVEEKTDVSEPEVGSEIEDDDNVQEEVLETDTSVPEESETEDTTVTDIEPDVQPEEASTVTPEPEEVGEVQVADGSVENEESNQIPEESTVVSADVEPVEEKTEPEVHAESEDIPEVVEPVSDSSAAVEEEEELGEDMFTDYSPEAIVRRAAWNKGLRCRRGYGEHNIPVAFVKDKVAVFVEPEDADRSIDQILADEGWTVLRYNCDTITDGKEQCEEIVQAVKANKRAAKAASKKKKTSKK